jgi:hypothetical protein
MNSKNQNFFQRYPLQGTETISVGEVPVPYHIYDGYSFFIGGTADLGVVQDLLKHEDLVPIQTMEGKAVMAIWVADFTRASLNSHHELQFSIFVSKTEVSPLKSHPFNAIYALTRTDIKMLCHGLWNNTKEVVAYNRELLGLNARLTKSNIQRNGNTIDFVFEDSESKTPIISGAIKTTATSSALFSFMSKLGFRDSLKLMREPWASMDIVNPKGVTLDENATAKAFAKSDVNVLHAFDSNDSLHIEHPLYKSLNFTPDTVQYTDGCKFIYLHPERNSPEHG